MMVTNRHFSIIRNKLYQTSNEVRTNRSMNNSPVFAISPSIEQFNTQDSSIATNNLKETKIEDKILISRKSIRNSTNNGNIRILTASL